MLILELESEAVAQLNPAAALLLQVSVETASGTPFCALFEDSSKARLREALLAARLAGSASIAGVRALNGALELAVRLSSFRAGAAPFLLVHLTPQEAHLPGASNDATDPSGAVFESVARAGFGFVLTNAAFAVTYANSAFATLVGIACADATAGVSLKRWLDFSATDLLRLADQMVRREAVTTLITTLVAEDQEARSVEVTAVAVPHASEPCWGFCIGVVPKLN